MEDENICFICYDELYNNIIIKLNCNHIFHLTCLFKWKKNQCPLCKVPYDFRLYLKEVLNDNDRYENIKLYCLFLESRVKDFPILLEFYNEMCGKIRYTKINESELSIKLDEYIMELDELLNMLASIEF